MAVCGNKDLDEEKGNTNPVANFEVYVNADIKKYFHSRGITQISDNDFLDFKAELYLDKMPLTVSNFIDLCDKKFYDGIHYHRIIDNFMLQFGCPNAKDHESKFCGQGNPKAFSEFKILAGKDKGKVIKRNEQGCIEDELTHKMTNEAGSLSMANTGRKNSGGSQFFLNLVHNKYLDWFDESQPACKHPVFGKCKDMTNPKIMSKVQCSKAGKPNSPLKMKRVYITWPGK